MKSSFAHSCRRRRPRLPMLVGMFLLTPVAAHAHLVQTGFGTFYDGLVHLAITPADALLVIGLALLAGLRGAPTSRAFLVLVPLVWLGCGWLGLRWPITGIWPGFQVLSFGVVGILIATDATLPVAMAVLLAGGSAAWHGYMNGVAMAQADMDRLSILGAACAIFAVVTLLSAVVVGLRLDWMRIVVRVAGSWIAAVAILMTGWLFRA